MTDDPRTEPEITGLLAALARHRVRHVVVGSGGARLYGADLVPGDLDVCPALDPDNLRRLAAALGEIAARPRVIPGWMTAEASAEWTPDPLAEASFDHLFETAFGDLDVVPRPYGPNGSADRFDYARLNERAASVTASGVPVRVADIDDLIASKLSRRRDKDLAALPELRRPRELLRPRS